MKLDPSIKIIKEFEGLELKAYLCPAKVLTIGYGHTLNVKKGQVCTIEQAEKWLLEDMQGTVNALNNCIKRVINENQFNALVSFVFNIGSNKFKSSTLYRLIENGTDIKICANQFDRWVYADSKKLDGLIRRRKKEKELFLS